MIPLIKKLLQSLLYDDMKVRRWLRTALMAMAASGMVWADQIAEIMGAPVKWFKIAAVICGALSVAINLGEKNQATAPDADAGSIQ